VGDWPGPLAARELNERGQAVTVIDPQAGDTCERPPLSKHLFDGARHHLPYHLESTEHITFVRDWAEEITLAEGAAETRYTAETQRHPHRLDDHHATVGTVHLASGESVDFTHCILATGMEANAPIIPNYPDALPVYDLDDAEWILAKVDGAMQPLNVGVLGSGYLGIEVAASAVAAGHNATVYLRGGEPLRKQLSAPVRQALFDSAQGRRRRIRHPHREPGRHRPGRSRSVRHQRRSPASAHPIDGDRPAEAWEVNESLATSHPGIFAAGDCAIITAGPYALEHPWACEPVAESHGKFLAEHLADSPAEAAPQSWTDVPWHWSFQGPEKVFTAGLTSPDADRHAHPLRPFRRQIPGLPLRRSRPGREAPRRRNAELATDAGSSQTGTCR
jgi:3-phenylpropionate/trans-cinnamate dioxygenase ferredoxin reductase subunit